MQLWVWQARRYGVWIVLVLLLFLVLSVLGDVIQGDVCVATEGVGGGLVDMAELLCDVVHAVLHYCCWAVLFWCVTIAGRRCHSPVRSQPEWPRCCGDDAAGWQCCHQPSRGTCGVCVGCSGVCGTLGTVGWCLWWCCLVHALADVMLGEV
jgi:hypothetical protein